MLRSVNSIVIAPARTGRDNKSKKAVTKTDQTKRGSRSNEMPGVRILITVVIKLMAARMEEAPARWRENIAKSTEPPAWANPLESGGYIVHPVPAPLSTPAEANSSRKEGGISQNLMLFIRGKAISGAPIIKGINQLPKPPIMMGITMKNIIIRAWAVTITL